MFTVPVTLAPVAFEVESKQSKHFPYLYER